MCVCVCVTSGACAERVRSGASKEIEMVCKWTPLLAGDWDRGDKLVGMCVVIGGDMCVCGVCVLFCVFLHTHWYVRMLFVLYTVWHF